MTETAGRRVLVVGLGNTFRGDDAVGLMVAQELEDRSGLEVRTHRGEALDLLNLWCGKDTVILVDALQSNQSPGTLKRIELRDGPLPLDGAVASTHLFGLRETIELARTLDRLPARLVFLGVTGSRFEVGAGISAEIQNALPELIRAVKEETRQALTASLNQNPKGCPHA